MRFSPPCLVDAHAAWHIPQVPQDIRLFPLPHVSRLRLLSRSLYSQAHFLRKGDHLAGGFVPCWDITGTHVNKHFTGLT